MKVSTYVFGYLRSWRRGRGGAEELKCGTMRVSLSCGDGDGADGGCHVSVAESAAISRPFALPFPLSMCLCERREGEEEGRNEKTEKKTVGGSLATSFSGVDYGFCHLL